MKTKIFNLILLTFVLAFTSCITSVDEIPNKFEDSEYTWNEISKDAAQTLWRDYPSGKQHNKATVYELYTANKIRRTEHCRVELESNNYVVSVMSSVTTVTFSFDGALENYQFFQAEEDSSLVKIVTKVEAVATDDEISADETDNAEARYIETSNKEQFFRNGWLILDKLITNTEFHHDMCYTYIVYED